MNRKNIINIINTKIYVQNLYKICKYIINTRLQSINLKHSFLFGFLLDSLNINLPDEDSHHLKFVYGILLVSLVCIFNFVNVVGYLTSIYLLSKYDVESKFPRLKSIIKYYEKSSLFFVVLEGVTCFILLLSIVIFCILELGLPIYKN